MAPRSPGSRSVRRVARPNPIRTECVRPLIERPMADAPVTRRSVADRRLPMPPRPLGDEEAASLSRRVLQAVTPLQGCSGLREMMDPRRPGEASRTPSSWAPFVAPSSRHDSRTSPATVMGGPALLSPRPCVEYRKASPPILVGCSAGTSATSLTVQVQHPHTTRARLHQVGRVEPEWTGVGRTDGGRASSSNANTPSWAWAVIPFFARTC